MGTVSSRCEYGALSGRHCRRKATTTRGQKQVCAQCALVLDRYERGRRNASTRARADRAWQALHPSAAQCDEIADVYDLDPQWAFHAAYWRDRAERLREGVRV